MNRTGVRGVYVGKVEASVETDTTLLTRYATRREAEAYAELTRRYAGLVYGTSLRIVGNRADAEDVTQECFLALARQAGQVRQSVAGWLHASARTRSLDTLRECRRRKNREAQSLPPTTHTDDAPWERVEPLVDEALAELPEELRQVIQLHFLAGRTQCETAAELGVSQATVSRRVENAIEQLRRLLKARGVAASVGALTLGLSAQAMAAVPAGLADSLVKIGLAGMGRAAGAAVGGLFSGVILMTGKALLAGAILAAILIGGYVLLVTPDDGKPAQTASSSAASMPTTAVAAKSLMDEMLPADGKWRREGDAWVGSGALDYANLVLPREWAGDAIVAEFDGRVDAEAADASRWLLCKFSAYRTPAESAQAREVLDEFTLRGALTGHPCYPWASLGHGWLAGQWTRERIIVHRWSDLSIRMNQWYHIKAERIGRMLRLWVDGVVVSEMEDDRPVPERLFVWLGSKSATNRFRDLKVYRPDGQYIAQHSKPDKVFSPSQQRIEILSRYPDTVLREASVRLGDVTEPDGLDEVAFSNITSEPARDKDGVECRRFTNSDQSKGSNYELVDKQAWGAQNDVFAEVEYLDAGPGSISIQYPMWSGAFATTEDVALGDSGQWKKARFWLRESDLGKAPTACLWISGLRTPKEELYLRSVRLVAVGRPKEAWEEVVRAYEQEIQQRQGEWTVPYYMIETARILETKLGRTEEAQALAKQVQEKYPLSSCLPMYKQWRDSSGGRP